MAHSNGVAGLPDPRFTRVSRAPWHSNCTIARYGWGALRHRDPVFRRRRGPHWRGAIYDRRIPQPLHRRTARRELTMVSVALPWRVSGPLNGNALNHKPADPLSLPNRR